MSTVRASGVGNQNWTWKIFRRWTIVNRGALFFAASTRFPPRRNLWFWVRNSDRFIDLRVWPLDFFWRKWEQDRERYR